MATEYKVGMVAELLRGGKACKKEKLVNLFSSPNVNYEPSQPRMSKRARPEETTVGSVKFRTEEKLTQSVSSKKENVKESSGMVDGFKPPKGIVHEALANANDKKKCKHLPSEDAENKELEINGKRPRRDRKKRANDKRTIFVGNVPLTADKKKLTKLFRQFGEIESIRFRCAPIADLKTRKKVAVIMKEFHEQRHNICSYICFKEEEAAKRALTLNGHLIDGLHIRVDGAKPGKKHETKRSIFVGNIPFAIEEECLRNHFEDCGEIENVRVIRDRKTNIGKGFCYITFVSKDSVQLAMRLQNSKLNGRELRIQRCVKQPKKDPKKGRKKTDLKSTAKNRTGAKLNKNKMWRPTNISSMQAHQTQKTALRKKLRQSEKKKKKRKVDEVTRVLGPVPQYPANVGAIKKTRTTRKGAKGLKILKKGL